MQSKSLSVIVDEVSNDSGLSLGTSRDSLQLDIGGDDYSRKEMERGNVSLTSEDFDDNARLDTFDTAFIVSKESETFVSSDLKSTKKVVTTFELKENTCNKMKFLGKRKGESLEDEEKDSDKEGERNLHKRMKRSRTSLRFSPSRSSPINLDDGEIKNEVNCKLPIIGAPQLSLTKFETSYRKEVSNGNMGKSTQEYDIKNILSEVKCNTTGKDGKFNWMSSKFSSTSDLFTSFEFDSNLIERRQILGKRRIPFEDLNSDGSPKIRKKYDNDGLYENFKHPRTLSTTSCTQFKSSFDVFEDVLDSEVKYRLPLVSSPQKVSTAFGSISGDTLVKVMKEHGEEFDKKYILVDCRYPYEYEGGHIKGAINFYDSDKVCNLFFPDDKDKAADIKRKVPIFYCEFSQKRGPGMASSLRSMDRKMNVYPEVSYKELYVLDRGYKKFFTEDKYHEYCVPSGYVPMLEKSFSGELKKYKHHHQSEHRRVRRILSRDKSSVVRSLEFKKRSFNFQSFD